MPNKLIRLWNDGKQWLAEYEGPEREDVVKLMGTALIPTAYPVSTPRERVIKELERLNPGYEIV